MPLDAKIGMRTALSILLGVTCIVRLGNGQDGALPSTPPPNGWGIHGNAAWSKAQNAAELERAALAARQKKALMEAMATHTQRPPVITTAEQFLSVNRPPAPPPGSAPAAPSPVRRDAYVPQFENTSPRTGGGNAAPPSAPAPPTPLPEKKGGLFGLFKSKESAEGPGGLLPPPGASDSLPPPAAYPEPGAMNPGPPPAVDSSERQAALAEATEGAPAGDKPTLFGKLFGKDKPAESAPPTAPVMALPPSAEPSTAPAPDPAGIPVPPSFNEPAPAPPAPPAPVVADAPPPEAGEASIFVRRSATPESGPEAGVLTTTQATVGGVLVRLYEGTKVTVLERSGSMARVRLPDGREGTVAASALGR